MFSFSYAGEYCFINTLLIFFKTNPPYATMIFFKKSNLSCINMIPAIIWVELHTLCLYFIDCHYQIKSRDGIGSFIWKLVLFQLYVTPAESVKLALNILCCWQKKTHIYFHGYIYEVTRSWAWLEWFLDQHIQDNKVFISL